MSGKYQKKKKRSLKLLWLLIAVVLIICGAVFAGNLRPEEEAPVQTTLSTVVMETAEVVETITTEPTLPEYLMSVDQNIKILEIGSYTGSYMEDASDEIVSDVMQIMVTNFGKEPLQYAKITLGGEAGEAVFEMTTLLPGETMVVLEINRKTYTDGDVYTTVHVDNLAYFLYEPSLQENKLKIQPLDGGFNITNISGEDITGRIAIYFKDYADGVCYGGITYSGTIEGGMKAGEIKQIMSDNFSASGTKVMFVNIG